MGKTNVDYINKRLEVGIEYLNDLVAVHEQLKKSKKKQLQETKKAAAEDNKQTKQKQGSSPPADAAKPTENWRVFIKKLADH